MENEKKDPLQKKIEVRNWLLLALFVSISFAFASLPVTLGIFFGGLVSIINFHWIYRDLRRAFQGPADRARQRVLMRYYLRLLVTAIILFLIIAKLKANVIGLTVGLSIVVINIVVTVVMDSLKKIPEGG
ncbi:MAG: ATP synthase subunit I [Syntrophales bacterium]|jgi:hypothetical protein|nr:ATP synthase subunit I [Syntrophales bacterium]MDY0043946.1 ATP synthase subunit I [Syntrophales bacterium]